MPLPIPVCEATRGKEAGGDYPPGRDSHGRTAHLLARDAHAGPDRRLRSSGPARFGTAVPMRDGNLFPPIPCELIMLPADFTAACGGLGIVGRVGGAVREANLDQIAGGGIGGAGFRAKPSSASCRSASSSVRQI